MAIEQVRRADALNRSEFHRRLREWIDNSDDPVIAPQIERGQTPWIYVRDTPRMFVLNADTGRPAVVSYLKLVERFGNDLKWEISASDRGNMTAVVYGPEEIRIKPFYFYVCST